MQQQLQTATPSVIVLPPPPAGANPLATIDRMPPKEHAPGIYFGMPSAEYHADPALSATDLKRLLVHPAIYWQRSWMNPEHEDDDTPARKEGRALHKLVLEGREAFEAAYAEEPSPENYPGALVTAKDMEAFCKARGIKGYSSKAKAELASLVRQADPSVTIWDDILGIFQAMVERDGKEALKPDALAAIKNSAATITMNPHLASAFKGGAPEVSVFYEEDGQRYKIRPDLLKPRTIVDLKKFANKRERSVDLAVRLAIAEYRYDIAARHYLDGYRHLYRFAREGRMFGDCPLPKGWDARLAEPDEILWTWVFHQLEAPVTLGCELEASSPALNRAAREIELAKTRYRECLEKFGTAMWFADEPIARITDIDLPAWMREASEE